jgi:hypothetical protein
VSQLTKCLLLLLLLATSLPSGVSGATAKTTGSHALQSFDPNDEFDETGHWLFDSPEFENVVVTLEFRAPATRLFSMNHEIQADSGKQYLPNLARGPPAA